MRILFVHHYFPGQFQRIAQCYLASGQHDIIAFHRGLRDGRAMPLIDGIRTLEYGQEVKADRPSDHVLYEPEQFIREAASMGFRAEELRAEGWVPDLVYSHTGWGTGAFLRDVFPEAKFVKYCEWFYNNSTDSTEFLRSDRPFLSRLTTSLMNIPALADLMRADLLIAPTEWQRSQFPSHMRNAIQVVPDGIDTELFQPDPNATFTTETGRTFQPGDRVITYVARGADPFRGFRQFIEALAIVQAEDPTAEAIIVGDRTIYYDGPGNGTEKHFHEVMAEARIDLARTHFTGTLPYEVYRKVLQVSAVHAYLTVPFVLSWSMLEALSTGCVIVASDTAPVREFVTHNENGLLADFFDPQAFAAQLSIALAGGPSIDLMRRKARQTILDRWSAEHAVTRHMALVAKLFS